MTFTAVITGDQRVLVSFDGRQVVALAGGDARKVIAEDEDAEQMVLAKVTGNFKRGNER